MLIEIHAHTREHSPCSRIRAADLVRSLHDKGVGGVVFTDHHYLWPEEEIRGIRAPLDIPDEFLVLAGQEVFTRDFGDVLVYGADRSIPQGIGLAELRRKYPEAALVWAHPYRSGQFPVMTDLFHACLDAIEVLNPRQTQHENERGIADWKTWGFKATSGSDIHDPDFLEIHPLHLQEDVTDVRGLADCIRRGACFPVLGAYLQHG